MIKGWRKRLVKDTLVFMPLIDSCCCCADEWLFLATNYAQGLRGGGGGESKKPWSFLPVNEKQGSTCVRTACAWKKNARSRVDILLPGLPLYMSSVQKFYSFPVSLVVQGSVVVLHPARSLALHYCARVAAAAGTPSPHDTTPPPHPITLLLA